MRLLHPKNNRGVALLIVLLVTALLIALVFEFSYATRISLNSAANFRDSQRAYFLALSGINAFRGSSGSTLRQYIPVGEWKPVPLIEGVTVMWEDESGKIRVNDVKSYKGPQSMVARLFENKQIDAAVYRSMSDPQSKINTLTLLTGLRQYMSAQDFDKVRNSLTVSPVTRDKININTASSDVLQSMRISADLAEMIVKERLNNPYTAADLTTTGRLAMLSGTSIENLNIFSYLTDKSSGYYKVYASAMVGDYNKTIEAIVNGSTVYYWKEL
ncbi:MAG: hypothetical protein A2010_19180 [Nitrospirae bacterium GWD2_57_9]|nr:MAG: hypothetical protein A2010_19180 [Nitrospirae bacterium GWD2_57_9]OGW49853.1 MAG: hypothetical protein A2078_07640 [Nitrospirae bacterium GWC2_57_9]